MAFKAHTEGTGITLGVEGSGKHATLYALEKAWGIYEENGPEFYEALLKLIAHTWNGASWSLQGSILGGVATFMKKYPYYSEKRFIKNLSSVDQLVIKREASSINRTNDIAYAVAIARLYNVGNGRGRVNTELLIV